jgi:hypothetical protein
MQHCGPRVDVQASAYYARRSAENPEECEIRVVCKGGQYNFGANPFSLLTVPLDRVEK